MRLCFVQHGEAIAKEIDPERPLSERGRWDVEQVAAFLATAGIRATAIFHSGKKRTQQTADILAMRIAASARAEKISGIDPLDPVEALVSRIDEWPSDTIVVGHQPFMGKLVSLLVTCNEEGAVVSFRPGCIICLEHEENAGWSMAWMIRPELLRREQGDLP